MGQTDVLAKYIKKQAIYPVFINTPPKSNLKTIVTIPAYNEPDIFFTLNSLHNCPTPETSYNEVIIIINHSEKSPNTIKQLNKRLYSEIQKWCKENSTENLSFHCLYVPDLPVKTAGAGLARKIVMDEAVRRFSTIENTKGVIASLDADTTVSANYFTEILSAFSKKDVNCTIFPYQHRIDENTSNKQKEAIRKYELYLNYFKEGLKYTGYPYYFQTIGSCFAVSAEAYAKQGGMNRMQAGEDFYFLHKIFPLNKTIELNSITVYPAGRVSDRVPFGTGPAIKSIIESGDYMTYNPIYFTYIKEFFQNITLLFKADKSAICNYLIHQHESIQLFIGKDSFLNKIQELNQNSASEKTFIHRFFMWFDAFRIIKYLNYVHTQTPRIPILKASKMMADNLGIDNLLLLHKK